MKLFKGYANTPAKRSYRRLLVVLFYSLLILGSILSMTQFDLDFGAGFSWRAFLRFFSSCQLQVLSLYLAANSTNGSSAYRTLLFAHLTES